MDKTIYRYVLDAIIDYRNGKCPRKPGFATDEKRCWYIFEYFAICVPDTLQPFKTDEFSPFSLDNILALVKSESLADFWTLTTEFQELLLAKKKLVIRKLAGPQETEKWIQDAFLKFFPAAYTFKSTPEKHGPILCYDRDQTLIGLILPYILKH